MSPISRSARSQAKYNPTLDVTIHGIRTRAVWQKTFATVISGSPTKTESFDFGSYGLPRFLLPPFNDRLVDDFYEWMSNVQAKHNIDPDEYEKRPSVIAHSLGSWILGHAMLKRPNLRFDKIILAGSILPRDFDWELLFSRKQVFRVRNECGKLDRWPGMAKRFVRGAGTGGTEGFEAFAPALENVYFEFAHSDSLDSAHMQTHWLPFLNSRPSPLTLTHGREIDAEKDFLKILNHTGGVIDEEAYAALPNFDDVDIPEGLAEQWIQINPDIYTFLIDSRNGVPAGYLNAMPVKNDTYEKIRNGTLTDNLVPASGIRLFEKNSSIKIYLMSMAISKSHRHWGQGVLQSAYLQLLKGFLDKMIWYAKNDRVRVTHLLATAWTVEGQRICEQFLMQPVGQDRFGDTIYELNLNSSELQSNPLVPSALKRLLETYKKINL
jgi:pimeloyl-ACP methyl ester carboxylesterase